MKTLRCLRPAQWRNSFHPRLYAALAALVYIGLVNLLFDYAVVFEFNPDEGNNLIKTLLLDRGFKLGSEVWTDQAPGFTYLLWGVFKLFGWSVDAARQAVLFFAGISIFVVYDVLRSSFESRSGHSAAIAGCIILFVSTLFVRLSVSVMIGLPAIAVMLLAVWCLNEYLEKPRAHWLVLSATLMGFSVGIKMFTGFLVPVYAVFLAVHLVRNETSFSWRHQARHFSLFLSGFIISFLICLSPLIMNGALSELLEPHLAMRMAKGGDADGVWAILGFIRQDRILFILALLGTLQALRIQKRSIYLWILWIFSAAVALFDHSPVWAHHRLLLTAPGAILAGYLLGEIIKRFNQC